MNFESQVIILYCIKNISILITIIFKYYVDKAGYDVFQRFSISKIYKMYIRIMYTYNLFQ